MGFEKDSIMMKYIFTSFFMLSVLMAFTQTSDKLVLEGMNKYKKGRKGAAIKLLTQAIEKDSSDYAAWYHRGYIYQMKNAENRSNFDYNKSIELSSNAIKKEPNNWMAYSYRGMAKQMLKDKEGACNDYRKVAEISGDKMMKARQEYCSD